MPIRISTLECCTFGISLDFMILWLLKGFQHNSEDAMSPWKRPSSEQQITNALSTEYLSTYRADYLGARRGFQMKYENSPTPRKKRAVPQCFMTEMKHSYRQPQNLAKLKNNTSRYGCNTLHGVFAKGIVPNVVFEQIRYQESKKPLATYSRHIGGKTVDNHGMLISLPASKQQQLSGPLLRKDKQLFEAVLPRPGPSCPAQRTEYPAAVCPQATKRVPAWISEWPGPL